MAPVVGVDVSHYQQPAQVQHAIDSGAKFVICKATEGADGTDVQHAAHVALARHAGAHIGHYHFARDVMAAAQEADHFVKVAGALPGEAVALDLEGMNGTDVEQVAYAVAWLHRVAVATGARPLFYTYKSRLAALEKAATGAQRASLQAYPLWIATGGLVAGTPGIAGWSMHQYSTAGGIDHDLLAPGVEWPHFAIPVVVHDPKPTPPPAPKEDDLDMATKLIVTAYDAPGTPPDARVLVDLEARTWAWLPQTADALAAVKAGAVEAPLSAEFVGGLAPVGPAPHA